jgi:hypothetical protein
MLVIKPYGPGFKEGDRVAYRAEFLRSIGDYSYERAQARGVVSGPKVHNVLIPVLWDDGEERHVHEANIWPADKLWIEPR